MQGQWITTPGSCISHNMHHHIARKAPNSTLKCLHALGHICRVSLYPRGSCTHGRSANHAGHGCLSLSTGSRRTSSLRRPPIVGDPSVMARMSSHISSRALASQSWLSASSTSSCASQSKVLSSLVATAVSALAVHTEVSYDMSCCLCGLPVL